MQRERRRNDRYRDGELVVDLSLDLNPSSPTYGDLLMQNNDFVLTSDANPAGTNPIQQDILTALRLGLGEWYLDITEGIDFFGQILVKNPDQSKIDAIIQNVIAGVPGVLSIMSYSFTPNLAARTFQISFSCMTTSGVVDYTGSINLLTGGSS